MTYSGVLKVYAADKKFSATKLLFFRKLVNYIS